METNINNTKNIKLDNTDVKNSVLTLDDILIYANNKLQFEIYKPWCNESYIDNLSTISFEENCITFENAQDFYFEDQIDNEISIKLVLRPMSDLTNDNFIHEAEKVLNRKFKIQDSFIECIENFTVKYYNFLIENKFDINGLIKKGFAIDINTI